MSWFYAYTGGSSNGEAASVEWRKKGRGACGRTHEDSCHHALCKSEPQLNGETYPTIETAIEAIGDETHCCFICLKGKREIVGLDEGTSEDGAFLFQFLRSVADRGLSGTELVISDAHR